MIKKPITALDQQHLFALIIYEPEHAEAVWEAYDFTDERIQLFLLELIEKGGDVEDILSKMDNGDRPRISKLSFDPLSDEGQKALAEARIRLLLPAVKAWEDEPKFHFTTALQARFLQAILRCSEMWAWADAMIKPEYFTYPPHQVIAKVILRHLREFKTMPSAEGFELEMNRELSKALSWLVKQEKIDPKMAEGVRQEYVEEIREIWTGGIPEDLDFVIKEMTRFVESTFLSRRRLEVAKLATSQGDIEKAKLQYREGTAMLDNPLMGPQVVADDRPLSSFTSRATNYLMQDRIPMGMVTLVCGDAGLGKSSFLTEIACRVSKGEALPGALDATVEVGSTLYVTTENDPERVFRPRALACGGDLDKIRWMRNVLASVSRKQGQPTVFDASKHLPAIERRIKEVGDIRLVVIDPIISHINEKIDPNSSSHVRQLLDTLSEFAAAHDVAMVVVGHMAKGVATSAVQKMAGSHQWVAAARVVLGVGREGEDEVHGVKSRVIKMLKANIYITDQGLEFNLVDHWVTDVDEKGEEISLRTAKVEWVGERAVDSESVFNPEKVEASGREKAVRIILKALKDEPLPEKEVLSLCVAEGVGKGSYYAARAELKVEREKMGFGPGSWTRLWLPEQWAEYQKEGSAQV
jgi:putative DNA primase/helicase